MNLQDYVSAFLDPVRIPYRLLGAEQQTGPVLITFYKHDSSDIGKVIMPVERDMSVLDLCDILSKKMEYNTTAFWSLVEFWVDKKAERVLEEHEIMVEAYTEMMNFKKDANVRYIMRQVLTKFDIFTNPSVFIHCLLQEGGIITEDTSMNNNLETNYLIKQLVDECNCPIFFSKTSMVYDKGWKNVFLLIKNGTLYFTDDTNGEIKLLEFSESCITPNLHEIPGLVKISELADLQIYRLTHEGNPSFEKCSTNAFLLRPIATPDIRSSATDSSARTIPVLPRVVIRCTSLSNNFATTWIALMRLAKYGKQLRENYRAFKNKNEQQTREFSRANVPNESVRSRVAMDFTGKQGRIVEDPVEANEIALAEGYMWKRRHKIPTRRTVNSKLNENHVDVGIHTLQPWFHSNLSRDQASSLVTRYGEGDGVFIVRPSRTSEGTYVLTYKCQGKLAHQQIVPMVDKERNITVFTLDNGQTKFYDILQLVEFYTVNLGPLMCRLTHYITENANIQNPNAPSPSNIPKYVNVAVNTDISIHSTEQPNLLESPSGSSKTNSTHSLSSR